VGVIELVAEAAGEPQVIVGLIRDGGHRSAPGQSGATLRKAVRSTLAYIAGSGQVPVTERLADIGQGRTQPGTSTACAWRN
jgi:hypothetical protein